MEKVSILFVLAALIAHACCQDGQHTPEEQELFEKWCERHGKKYESPAEAEDALKKLLVNKAEIDAHNERFEKGEVPFKRGLFRHSDMSLEEKKQHLGGIQVPPTTRSLPAAPLPIFPTGPASIDWGERGLVGPVQDQGTHTLLTRQFENNLSLSRLLWIMLGFLSCCCR